MKIATKPLSVADYLAQQIVLCGKSQKDIAREVGYDKPNVITMFKQGATKVPIAKVGPLARALDVDPAYFLRLVLSEYLPDTWAAIEDALDGTILTRNELLLVKEYRRRTGNTDPIPSLRSKVEVPVLTVKALPAHAGDCGTLAEGESDCATASGDTAVVAESVTE